MKIHPVAELFPMMPDAELREMADSIARDGLLNPCTMQADTLLDGRNRLAACKLAGVEPRFVEYHGSSPVAFIIAANLARRHLEFGQKVALGLEIEPHFAEEAEKRLHLAKGRGVKGVANVPQVKSRDSAARAVGISGKTLQTAKDIQKKSPERFEKIKAGKLTVARAKKELKAEQDKEELANAQENISVEKRRKIESVCDIRACSCGELFASGIKPDVVICDPPYPKEFLPVFSELAEACKNVPVVAVMSGQSYLPEVLRRLCEHLEYRWTLAYMTPGGQAVQQWQAKVNTTWKPILLFGKSTDWFGDVATSKPNDNDKRFHNWGQSESGMADLVERLTKPGQLVCDPFLGGGTTAVVALALGRRFVGCDVDAAMVEQAIGRVLV